MHRDDLPSDTGQHMFIYKRRPGDSITRISPSDKCQRIFAYKRLPTESSLSPLESMAPVINEDFPSGEGTSFPNWENWSDCPLQSFHVVALPQTPTGTHRTALDQTPPPIEKETWNHPT